MSKLEVIYNYVFHPKYQHGTSSIKSTSECLIARNNANQLIMVLYDANTIRSTRFEIEQGGAEGAFGVFMSRLTVLHQHWILHSTPEGAMIYPTTILREEVFHDYVSNIFPWASLLQKQRITQSFKLLPYLLEEMCLD